MGTFGVVLGEEWRSEGGQERLGRRGNRCSLNIDGVERWGKERCGSVGRDHIHLLCVKDLLVGKERSSWSWSWERWSRGELCWFRRRAKNKVATLFKSDELLFVVFGS